MPKRKKQPSNNRTRYPWEKWFTAIEEKGRLRLVRGKHYRCQPHSMSVQIRARAIQFGYTLSVKINDDVLVITPE